MKKKIIFPFFLAIFLCLVGCENNSSSTNKIDHTRFKNPFTEDRATVFYSLNDSLKPEIVKEQIKQFAAGGVGGVFLHAREGLLTQYFEQEWWDVIDEAVQQCIDEGIHPWFYDEYKWPSGYAAGYVPAQSPDYRGRYLVRVAKGKPLPEDGEIVSEDENYTYVCMTTTYGDPWLNGTCKIDYLNPEAVETFIRHTYQTYAGRNKQKYAMAGKGIFFDEPDIMPSPKGRHFDGAISYSPHFRETFLKEKGYDIADHFAELYEEKDGYRKVRLDYWQMISAQYEKAFVGQLGEFCRANNLILTGHFFPEETLAGCKAGIGNLMRQLRNEDMPGMDHLELRIEGGLNVAKSVSAVANQYGKARRMSELFGVSGQNMSFEDRKWIANWHAVLGINFFVEHLALYSMKGERKRDFPPVLSHQQPWWAENKQIEDYMARLCYMGTIGEFAATTLLLVPIESEYIANEKESRKLFADYYSAMENLMDIHCDFDLGDEQIIEEIGEVTGSRLKIGNMQYEYIVIPELLTLRETTLNKLIEFSRQGGRLFVLGNYACYINGQASPLLEELKQSAILLSNTKQDLCENLPILPVVHRPEAYIYTQKRTLQNGEVLFITNLSRTETETVTILFNQHHKNITLWNPENGEHYKLITEPQNKLELKLEPAAFYILTTGNISSATTEPPLYSPTPELKTISTIQSPWTGKKQHPNAITLDYARYSTDGGTTYSNSEPIIGITSRLNAAGYNGPLQLIYEVQLAEEITNACLVVESPYIYQSITINDIRVESFQQNKYYWDHSFKKSADISPNLHIGKNKLTFTLNYKCPVNSDTIFSNRYGTEVESIYLVGDFAVEATKAAWNKWETEKNQTNTFIQKPIHQLADFRLKKEPTTFTADITQCGYPFYSGGFELTNIFRIDTFHPTKQYYINLPLSEAIIYELIINGQPAGKRTTTPLTWNITSYIREGENQISFILINSLRNLLGPHHHKGGELKGTSPLSFTGTGGWPHKKGNPNWYDLRITTPSNLIIWTDTYNLLPFGFIKAVEVKQE